jgi:regulator of sigma E protease
MEVLIFIVVLVVLILVHELGHLVVAKWAGMRVDEFGVGYPPRALTLGKIGETVITLNWLPFGGFVKIYGEDANAGQARDPRSFTSKNRFAQALVLIAGITMNLLFAFVLLTAALAAGTPRALSDSELAVAKNVQLAVAAVAPASPGAVAGIMPGDTITSASDASGRWSPSTPLGVNDTDYATAFTSFIAASRGAPITLEVERNGKAIEVSAAARQGVVPSDPERWALGLSIAPIGIVPLSLGQSIMQGAQLTYAVTKETAIGLAHFFASIFTLSANLSQISGPVGIAGVVGSAAQAGFGDLLSIAALISINLALINLIPVPALDGGRLLFVIVEAITRRPIKRTIANSINAVGFAFLVLLMVVVTLHDIYKIVI